MTSVDNWNDNQKAREQKIETGMRSIRADWRAFLGLVIAAPDQATLLAWIAERFGVDEDVAEVSLEQQLRSVVTFPAGSEA